MKKRTILAISLGIFLVLMVALVGLCLGDCKMGGENFGELKNTARTAIGTIILNPQEYINKEVVVEGVITSECPGGGWINVKDESGATIYVEMHGASFAPIPQRVGKNVVVNGLIYQTESTPKEIKILGQGVSISDFSCAKLHDCPTGKLASLCCCQYI